MPSFHEDDEEDPTSYALSDLENGQHSSSRLLNTEEDSDTETYNGPHSRETRTPTWIEGHQPPRPYTIVPIGGSIQSIFADKLKELLPESWQRVLLALIFFAIWFFSFVLVIHTGYARDLDRVRLSCTSSLWYSSLSLSDPMYTDFFV